MSMLFLMSLAALRNSLILFPIDLPISGNLLGPKTIKATTSTTTISHIPILPNLHTPATVLVLLTANLSDVLFYVVTNKSFKQNFRLYPHIKSIIYKATHLNNISYQHLPKLFPPLAGYRFQRLNHIHRRNLSLRRIFGENFIFPFNQSYTDNVYIV